MVTLTLRLSDDLHARLVAAAAQEHRSVNGQINSVLEHGLPPLEPDSPDA